MATSTRRAVARAGWRAPPSAAAAAARAAASMAEAEVVEVEGGGGVSLVLLSSFSPLWSPSMPVAAPGRVPSRCPTYPQCVGGSGRTAGAWWARGGDAGGRADGQRAVRPTRPPPGSDSIVAAIHVCRCSDDLGDRSSRRARAPTARAARARCTHKKEGEATTVGHRRGGSRSSLLLTIFLPPPDHHYPPPPPPAYIHTLKAAPPAGPHSLPPPASPPPPGPR